eukprot:gene38608-46936_t
MTVADFTLRSAGPAFFLGLQGCSIQTALNIVKTKSVGGLSLMPFLSLFTNCVIWTYYGILKKDNTVLVPNVLGLLAGFFCTSVYTAHSTKGNLVLYVISASLLIFCTMAFVSEDASILGGIGCLLAVILMGSPLATLKTVIRDQSTAALPFGVSLMTWGNALSWSLYGLILAQDPMIYGPNLAGLVLASVQMYMFVLYGLPPPTDTSKTYLPL